MNAFAESPLLFFMDNISPILSVNTSKEGRRIVELADTGCDARLSAQSDRNFRHSAKLPKLKLGNWILYNEDDKYDKCYDERFRMRNKRNTVDPEDYHLSQRNDSTNQCRWPRYPRQDEPDDDKYKSNGRKSPTREGRTRLKSASPETHRWKEEKRGYEMATPTLLCPGYNGTASSFPKSVHAMTRERLFEEQPRRGSRIGAVGSSKFANNDHQDVDLHGVKREARSVRENEIHMVLDYPENFETVGHPSGGSKIGRDHGRRSNGSSVIEAKSSTAQQSQRCGKSSRTANARSARIISGSVSDSPRKSSESTKDWRDTADRRIRSRTRSPPIDRRKGARPCPKLGYEDVDRGNDGVRYGSEPIESFDRGQEEIGYCQPRKTDSDRSTKMFVDRAVDKDSLSGLLNVATSVERLSDRSEKDFKDPAREDHAGQERVIRSTYWDFIPLDENDYTEFKKIVPGKEKLLSSSGNNRWLTEGSVRDRAREFRSRVKAADEEQGDSLNLFSYKDSTKPMETTLQTPQGTSSSNDSKPAEVSKNLCNEQQRCRSTDDSRHLFGYRKLPIVRAKSESTDDREKRSATVNVLDRKRTKAGALDSSMGKIGRSSAGNDLSVIANRSTTAIDKRFRSVVPIRVTNRRRSRNPNAARFRFLTRLRAVWERKRIEEESRRSLTKDSIEQPIVSVRSRTKPKSRPSVLHNRVVIDPVDDLDSCSRSEDGQTKDRTKGFVNEQSTMKSESLANSNVTTVGHGGGGGGGGGRDNSKDRSNDKRTPKHLNGDTDDKFRNYHHERKEFDGSTNYSHTDDEERRSTKSTNGSCARKSYQKSQRSSGFSCNGLKDICCFYLNDAQNIVCNRYLEKGNRKADSAQTRKPTLVSRSRL